jgi:hypothetical protein
VLAVTLVGGLVGCASASQVPTSVASPSVAPASPGRAVLKLGSIEEIATTHRGVFGLSAWKDHFAWGQTTESNQTPNSVMVYDLRTRTGAEVAAGKSRGQIDPVVGGADDEDLVFFVQLGNAISDLNPNTTWTLSAVNTKSGARKEIAAEPRPSLGLSSPTPSVQGQWVAWAQLDPSTKKMALMSFDLTASKSRSLLPDVNPSVVSVWDGIVYYDSVDGAGHVDVYGLAADGSGPPRKLTGSGLVALPRAANGWLAWQEPQRGDPQSEWLAPLDKPQSVIRLAGGTQGNGHPGAGFAIWLNSDGALVAGTGSGDDVVIDSGNVNVAARWSVFGDTVVWADHDKSAGLDKVRAVHIQAS